VKRERPNSLFIVVNGDLSKEFSRLVVERRINDMARQLRQWIIEPGDVHGGPAKTQLFNCSLVRDELTGEYMFFGPTPERGPEARHSSPVAFPFTFPTFTAALNGTQSRDWYITVDHVHGEHDGGFAQGHWSNSPPTGDEHSDGNTNPGDADTWTTQAGVGPGAGDDPEKHKEKDKRAAASASVK
jgi:hypothetical protein